MRVLLLGSLAGSLINFRGPLIAAMIEAGHEVHVGAPEIDEGVMRALQALGATVHDTKMTRHGTNLLSDLTYLKMLAQLMRRVQPDLAVTYTIKPNIWGAFAARLNRVRSVSIITGLGLAFTDTGGNGLERSTLRSMKTSLVRWIARSLYRCSTGLNDRVIFQNPDDRDDFIKRRCLKDPSKVRMVNGSGVDLGEFVPATLPDTADFLMVSRILGAKGVREYARAAIDVMRTHPQARFRLVGFFDTGPDAVPQQEVDSWVAEGLEYLGPSADVRPHLSACRVYVLPSYREGTPRSVLEAMATGRAIITSDAPGCRETVEDGVNGFLVPVGDPADLAKRMRWMIDNPDDCARMSVESLRIVRQKYDVRKVNEIMLKHLELV